MFYSFLNFCCWRRELHAPPSCCCRSPDQKVRNSLQITPNVTGGGRQGPRAPKSHVHTHVFAADLLLGQLDLDQGSDGGEELPPGPALHAPVLLDVLLDAADGQVLDLVQGKVNHNANGR